MNALRRRTWSPYAVGALIGILSWVAFLGDHPIGVSTAFVRTVGVIERTVASDHVGSNAYFAKFPPRIDWEWMLVLGVFLGAFASAMLGGDRVPERVPELWRRRFGSNPARRAAAAFGGGFLVMFGARLAGGCTSGHGISGTLQLALSSWTFLPALFAAGVLTAFALYGRERHHV
jgi:uncharacterized membrane protein YedE/YeeE